MFFGNFYFLLDKFGSEFVSLRFGIYTFFSSLSRANVFSNLSRANDFLEIRLLFNKRKGNFAGEQCLSCWLDRRLLPCFPAQHFSIPARHPPSSFSPFTYHAEPIKA